MDFNFDLLKRLSETPGIAGYEGAQRAIAMAELRPLTDELRTDRLGNVIARKRGDGPKVMVAAHMDEIGFLVKFVDEKGFLRLQPVGGWDPKAMFAQRVLVRTEAGALLRGVLHSTAKPPHIMTDEDRKRAMQHDDYFVDLGLPAETVREQVQLGDMVTMDRTCERLGGRVVGKALDDRAGVFVMIEALRALRSHRADIYAVATVQEEVGLRGAETAAFQIEPDIAVALDGTLAIDLPGAQPELGVSELGKGVAIKIFDSSHLSHPRLIRHLKDIARREGIPYQLELLPRGGTDAGAMQRVRGGAPAITISLPMRYVHTVNEMADIGDLQGAITLLARYLEEADRGDYAL
ncbi:MAG: M42 family metallopeptidase [Dehalococcoidia bacterium]